MLESHSERMSARSLLSSYDVFSPAHNIIGKLFNNKPWHQERFRPEIRDFWGLSKI